MEGNLLTALEMYINIDLIEMIISNSSYKEKLQKIKVRPVLIQQQVLFQASEYRGKKVLHFNYEKQELIEHFEEWLFGSVPMKQVEIITKENKVTILLSKKGKATIKCRKQDFLQEGSVIKQQDLSHNRNKKYIIEEGTIVPFFIDLGVMTQEGKIVNAKYDKFRQINRFLEFIEDILPNLQKDRELTIIDFGCGKSYLTFAMYYYLKELKNYNIRIIGLDLKEDVIEHCNQLSKKYGYDKLTFLQGDIASYEGVNAVDMVVSLHACDTATDYALYKAIKWNANVILSVPCCQHELNNQIQCKELEPIFQYGLIKERTAALLTDAIRANLLEEQGYRTQILEFIDMEHTPKNILIRAVKMKKKKEEQDQNPKLEQLNQFFGITPKLGELLKGHE
jgi:hypothetical protein